MTGEGEAIDVLTGQTQIVKEGYLWKRGEYIKNWRARYYILLSDGNFLGYKSKPVDGVGDLQNDFTVKDCVVTKQEKPKPHSFTLCGLKRDDVVNRLYNVETKEEQEEWITAIQTVSESLNQHPLYDPELLRTLSLSDLDISSSSSSASPLTPDEGLQVRPLQLSDYDRGFTDLLSQGSGNISKQQFNNQFKLMEAEPKHYFITVIENIPANQIVCTATLVRELKFSNRGSGIGKIQDVMANTDFQGIQLEKLLVEVLTSLSKKIGCYKVEHIDEVHQF